MNLVRKNQLQIVLSIFLSAWSWTLHALPLDLISLEKLWQQNSSKVFNSSYIQMEEHQEADPDNFYNNLLQGELHLWQERNVDTEISSLTHIVYEELVQKNIVNTLFAKSDMPAFCKDFSQELEIEDDDISSRKNLQLCKKNVKLIFGAIIYANPQTIITKIEPSKKSEKFMATISVGSMVDPSITLRYRFLG